MIENQIIARGITDKKLIEAMRKVPREEFVPDAYKESAFNDGPLPIGYNQTISQPYIVALMTMELELEGEEKVLEIGTGSGYQSAILANLVDFVYSVEVIEELADSAVERLEKLEYKNVEIKRGNGYEGWKENAPFDRIILTAAPEEIPYKLIEQLKPGGIMLLPVGKSDQRLKKLIKTKEGEINEKTITAVRFVPMVQK